MAFAFDPNFEIPPSVARNIDRIPGHPSYLFSPRPKRTGNTWQWFSTDCSCGFSQWQWWLAPLGSSSRHRASTTIAAQLTKNSRTSASRWKRFCQQFIYTLDPDCRLTFNQVIIVIGPRYVEYIQLTPFVSCFRMATDRTLKRSGLEELEPHASAAYVSHMLMWGTSEHNGATASASATCFSGANNGELATGGGQIWCWV